jgi:hypothetical protein
LKVVFICRLEKLPSDYQVVARYASAIGDEFTFPRLFNILPSRFQINLEACLNILSEYGFILCVGQNPPSYAFQNLLIRKFLYDLTPFSEVVKIHESIGKYLEIEQADNLHPYYSILSYHFLMSDECSDLAFKYTVKAADQAIYQGAFADGLNFVQRAVKIESDVSNKRRLLRVIERAIDDLSPKGLFFKPFSSRKKDISASDAILAHAVQSEIEGFKAARAIVIDEIHILDPNGDKYAVIPSRIASFADKNNLNNSKIEDTPSMLARRQTLQEAWEPSYTGGKTTKSVVRNGVCVVM